MNVSLTLRNWLICRYIDQLYLPAREQLQRELERALQEDR
jgi:hypothetical protein